MTGSFRTWNGLSLPRALLVAGACAWTLVIWFSAVSIGDHHDLWAYWRAALEQPYTVPFGIWGYFAYSPAYAQVFALLRLLPWDLAIWLWASLALGALAYCARRWTPLVILAPPILVELMLGNVHLLYAALIVLGFRYPATWAFVLLTKVTPGVGLIWFAVRREWRKLTIALGVTLTISAVSATIAPGLWVEWLGVLAKGDPGDTQFDPLALVRVPLLIRLPLAVALVAWGARTDRRWTVPVAATLALPVLWTEGLSMLVAVIPLLHRQQPSTPSLPRLAFSRLRGGPVRGCSLPTRVCR